MRDICLSGFSELTRHYANELPESTEIWAMNEANLYLKRPAHYWFQIHPRHWNAENAAKLKWEPVNYGRPPQHIEWLQKLNIPIWQMAVDERIPMSRKYPLAEITERYGKPWIDEKKRLYATSTAAYMLALAMYEHDLYKEQHPRGKSGLINKISLAGIELAIGTEYADQRPCVEYWLGVAEGKGITVDLAPSGSSILTGPLYAIEHDKPFNTIANWASVKVGERSAPVASISEDEDGNPIGLDDVKTPAETI